MTYIAGDPWKICDICGFRYRSSQTRKRWDNLIVCSADYEEQHPQDFVRGRKDQQNVPDARPDSIATFIGPLTTIVSAVAAAGATTISVESSVRFEAGDDVGIMLSSGESKRFVLDSVPTSTSLVLTAPLSAGASVGALVINYDAVAEADIG